MQCFRREPEPEKLFDIKMNVLKDLGVIPIIVKDNRPQGNSANKYEPLYEFFKGMMENGRS